MAWEISITAEGWQEIRDKLDDCSREFLIDAICDDKFEEVYLKSSRKKFHNAEQAANSERRRLSGLPHDILADRAFELIEQNNTCDNGGFAYMIYKMVWIDREGDYKVTLNE